MKITSATNSSRMGHSPLLPHGYHSFDEIPPATVSNREVEVLIAKLKKRNRRNLAIIVVVLIVALLIGMIAHRYLNGDNWVDATYNASLIVGGLGPLKSMKSNSGKIFVSIYALFSGAFFLILFGIILQNLVDIRTQIITLEYWLQRHST